MARHKQSDWESNPKADTNERDAADPQDDSLAGAPEPTTFDEAWKGIKAAELCSTQQAMGLAMDRYPNLYAEYWQQLPRKKK